MEKRQGIDPGLAVLLEKAPSVELEYGFVMDCLKQYRNPRVKLNHLLKMGALIRVKKGIYIFGKLFAKHPYCSEILANMIYGPSYVSLEWACQYWRLIPEKVTVVTSVTTKLTKRFDTPLGTFTYDHLPVAAYSPGMTYVRFSERQQALIASKEKALIDLLVLRRGFFSSTQQIKKTLYEDLRIDEEDIKSLDLALIEEINAERTHSAIKYLIQLVKKESGI